MEKRLQNNVWCHKKNTNYSNYEIILIDNGSKDGSIETLKKLKKKGLIQKLVLNKTNQGFARANNQGFKFARGEYYLMLNNDIIATERWLTELIKLAESDKKIAAVSNRLLSPKQYKKGIKPQKDKEKLAICGDAMLMKKSAIDRIGILDDKEFSPIYGEEQD